MRLWNFFNKIIEYGFLGLFFFVPLIFNPSRTLPSFELFEWNKMWFTYLAAVIITGAWVGKMILQRRIIFRRTPLDLPILLFLISQIISTVFSIDRHVSIFGYYSRFNGGLLSTICYILLFYAYVSNAKIFPLKKIALTVFTSAAIVAIYGIAEHFGIDKNMWVQDVQARVFSTLGQPNWLAAYLAILLPLFTGISLQHFNNFFNDTKGLIQNLKLKIKNDNEKFKNILLLACHFSLITIFYICLLFTRSRSGFLGFWGANVVFWISLFWLNRNKFVQFAKVALILNFSFLILNFIIGTPFPQYNKIATLEAFSYQEPPQETRAPPGDSVINVGITDSADIRGIVWQGAFDIAKVYPLVGTGPETFAYAYYKFRPASHNLTSEWDFLYNKAHNEYLNFAATSGFIGLGAYALLILTFIFWCIYIIFLNTKYKIQNTTIAFLASYISILITNFFGFSVVVVNLFFFLLPAVCISINNPKLKDEIPNFNSSLKKPQILSLILLSGAVLYLTVSLFIFWFADSAYAQAISFNRQEEYHAAYPLITTAVKLRPDEPNYHDERANTLSNLVTIALDNKEASFSAEIAREALNESNMALQISPQNVNFWKTRTKIFYLFSTWEPSFTQNALDAILVAHSLAPTDAKIAYNVAVLYGRVNNNQEAIKALQKTIDLKPDYRDAYLALAIFYEEEKQIDKARQTLELILKRINPDDQEVKEKLEKLK